MSAAEIREGLYRQAELYGGDGRVEKGIAGIRRPYGERRENSRVCADAKTEGYDFVEGYPVEQTRRSELAFTGRGAS